MRRPHAAYMRRPDTVTGLTIRGAPPLRDPAPFFPGSYLGKALRRVRIHCLRKIVDKAHRQSGRPLAAGLQMRIEPIHGIN